MTFEKELKQAVDKVCKKHGYIIPEIVKFKWMFNHYQNAWYVEDMAGYAVFNGIPNCKNVHKVFKGLDIHVGREYIYIAIPCPEEDISYEKA